MERSALTSDLQSALHYYFKLPHFREGQREIIETVIQGDPVLAILPTGGGKSLCYQLPALLLEGISLIISPLIALMKDQMDALVELGIPATFLNSSLSAGEYEERFQGMIQGNYKIVYVAPERFRNAQFRKHIFGLRIGVFAVDEAHCISQWGHDFRPDYRRLGKVIEDLKPRAIIALTATATEQVQQDIINQLKIPKFERFIAGFDRSNLMLRVEKTESTKDKFRHLESLLESEKGSVIVYCATRRNAEKVADYLSARRFKAVCYHGGLEDTQRTDIQDDFMSGRAQIVVATNAFGMGIDKQDIRQVIHFDVPGTIEAYYQEAGRAGRDHLPASCTILFQYADRHILDFFIEGSHPSREILEELYEVLVSYKTPHVEVPLREMAQKMRAAKNEMSLSSGLKILEEYDLIERTHRNENSCTIVLRDTMKNILFHFRNSDSQRADLLRCLQQEHSFEEGTIKMTPQYLCNTTGLDEEQLKRALHKLEEEGYIEYIPAHRGRGINMLQSHLNPKFLPIDYEQIELRAQHERSKLEIMFEYAFCILCRRRFILNYFGDKKELKQCTSCDNCLRPVPPLTPAQKLVVVKVLSGVARTNGRYGKVKISQMLCGSKSKDILDAGLDKLTTYNLLSDYTQEQILSVLDALIQLGALKVQQTKNWEASSSYPTLFLTAFGKEVMKSEKEVQFAFPSASLKKETRKKKKETIVLLNENHDKLYQELLALRKEIAQKEDIPSYRVFQNKTLAEFCEKRPKNKSEMLNISGVGPVLLEKYGDRFLTCIQKHLLKR
jgi:ATP-dependent DNA helicase RecQ